MIGATGADAARRGNSLGLTANEMRPHEPTVAHRAEIVDQAGRLRERAGVTRVYLQLLDLADLDQLELVAAEVAPQLA